jgi:hypothetical protein
LPPQSIGSAIGTRLVTHLEAFRVRERTARSLNVLRSGSFPAPVRWPYSAARAASEVKTILSGTQPSPSMTSRRFPAPWHADPIPGYIRP